MNQANDEVWRLARRIGEANVQPEAQKAHDRPEPTKVYLLTQTVGRVPTRHPHRFQYSLLRDNSIVEACMWALDTCCATALRCHDVLRALIAVEVDGRGGAGTPSLSLGHLRHLNIGSHTNESSPGGVCIPLIMPTISHLLNY